MRRESVPVAPLRGRSAARYTRVMRIAVGSDHAGFDLKTDAGRAPGRRRPPGQRPGHRLARRLGRLPRFGLAVGRAVAEGRADRGVCVCGTGIGISIAANKVDGVRAALVHDVTTAGLARRHNDANVICLGGRTTGVAEAIDAVDAFFSTDFEGGRHQRAGRWTTDASTATPARPDRAERQRADHEQPTVPPRPSTAGWPTTPRSPACWARRPSASRPPSSSSPRRTSPRRPCWPPPGRSSPTSTPRATPGAATTAGTRSSTRWRTWPATG